MSLCGLARRKEIGSTLLDGSFFSWALLRLESARGRHRSVLSTTGPCRRNLVVEGLLPDTRSKKQNGRSKVTVPLLGDRTGD